MATIKISALTEKTTLSGTEEVLINDSGTSKKFSTQRFLDIKTAAETAETNAAGSAATASADAATATTQASTSTGQATISTDQATISTAKAVIATTKASEASASATTAASFSTTLASIGYLANWGLITDSVGTTADYGSI
jgi:hypothetical protein